MAEVTLIKAINDALATEMARDPSVCVLGPNTRRSMRPSRQASRCVQNRPCQSCASHSASSAGSRSVTTTPASSKWVNAHCARVLDFGPAIATSAT